MYRKKLIPAILLSIACGSVMADADDQSPETLRKSATAYEYGRDGIKQDFQQAFSLYCRASLQGDAESAYSLGFMYFNGRGVDRNLSLAMHWFKQAAERGDMQAGHMLSRFADVQPMDDRDCQPEPVITLPEDMNPNRLQIQGWVNQIAPNYGIDPLLVMAVIRAESAYDPTALSPKNAQGLMQLIPETAERFGVKDVWNPIQNIKGGVAYLHWLLRHFEGKVEWVLAAYNAGERAVESYKGIPPYLETQNYVKGIMATYPRPWHPIPPEFPVKLAMFRHKT